MQSLKKMGYISFAGVASLLILVIIFSIRQYQLTERYSAISTQSEEMVFQFSTIREQITTSLIEKDWDQIINTANQLKILNSSLARLQENTLIPGEYRLDMAKQFDLSGLAIASKEILSSKDKTAHSLNLQNKMRILAEYLIQFDRIIVSQMRAKVVQFQTVMIGALGTVICLISFSLLFLYKKTMVPLFHIIRQTEDPAVLTNGIRYNNEACSEIAMFIDAVNNLIKRNGSHSKENSNQQPRNEQHASIINESNNLSNGIINYAQLLADSYGEAGIGKEETKILQNIIHAAERVAQLNKEI
jgi:hypothetical protein